MTERRHSNDINPRVIAFADWIIRGLIVIACTFVWKMYEAQQIFINEISTTNMRVTQLEKDIARVEGNMVTIETLKRVEIYMELIMARSGIKTKVDLVSKDKSRGNKNEP